MALALGRSLVERIFHDHPTKHFAVRLWDGSEVAWRPERDFTLVFRDPATFGSLFASRDPSMFAEAYIDERMQIEGDVASAAQLASYFRDMRHHPVARLLHPIAARSAHLRHTPRDDSHDVRAHYDLSDDFFRLFLDERMVYSCAYFARADQDLEGAQERKLDLVCRKLQLKRDESLLDVGCGWGALVLWAAERYGVRAHGITLSSHQAEAARARVAAAGLSERVTIEQRHYGDLPKNAFDKIASVGMIEHVGIANYAAYFRALHRALRPAGLLLNHGITQPPYAPAHGGGRFIRQYVFPGAEIDELAHTLTVMEGCGFEVLDVQSLRPHYALTLGAWERRFVAHRAEAARIVPQKVLRTWDLYLPGCRMAFEDGTVAVHQTLASKPGLNGQWLLPLTREELTAETPT